MEETDFYFLGIFVCFVSLVVSRWLSERAHSTLDAVTKVRMVSAFARERALGLLPVIPLTVIAFLLTKYFSHRPNEMLLFIMACCCATVAGMMGRIFRKLLRLQFPRQFVKRYFYARAVAFGGFLLLIMCLVTGWFYGT